MSPIWLLHGKLHKKDTNPGWQWGSRNYAKGKYTGTWYWPKLLQGCKLLPIRNEQIPWGHTSLLNSIYGLEAHFAQFMICGYGWFWNWLRLGKSKIWSQIMRIITSFSFSDWAISKAMSTPSRNSAWEHPNLAPAKTWPKNSSGIFASAWKWSMQVHIFTKSFLSKLDLYLPKVDGTMHWPEEVWKKPRKQSRPCVSFLFGSLAWTKGQERLVPKPYFSDSITIFSK